MSAVNRTHMIISEESLRINEIYILIRLHPPADHLLCSGLLAGFPLLILLIEVPRLPSFCLEEDQRSLRMGSTDHIHKRVEPFAYLCGRGVREGIKYEGIRLSVCQDHGELLLELGFSAEPEIAHIISVIASKARRICHSGTACRNAVSDAGPLEYDLELKRILHGLDACILIDTDFQRVHPVKHRKIEKALLHPFRHISDNLPLMGIDMTFLYAWSSDTCKHPLAILPYIEVKPLLADCGHVCPQS